MSYSTAGDGVSTSPSPSRSGPSKAATAPSRRTSRSSGSASDRLLQIAYAQHHAFQHSWVPWPVGREQRELAAPGIGAHQREVVGAIDHVHAKMAAGEVGEGVAVGDPEGDMIEGIRLHGRVVDGTRSFAGPIKQYMRSPIQGL